MGQGSGQHTGQVSKPEPVSSLKMPQTQESPDAIWALQGLVGQDWPLGSADWGPLDQWEILLGTHINTHSNAYSKHETIVLCFVIIALSPCNSLFEEPQSETSYLGFDEVPDLSA